MKKTILLLIALLFAVNVNAQTATLPVGATKAVVTTFLTPFTGSLNPSTPLTAQYGGTGVNGSSATNGFLLIGNGSGYTLAGLTGTASQITVTNGSGSITLSIPTSPAFTTPVITGLATGSGVASAATASTLVSRDANANISGANWLGDYATTVTAAGTTTLAVGSTYLQYFTGTTTQIVTMPVASTLVLGQQYQINNLSSGLVTVQSSGANSILVLGANTSATITCTTISGTTATSWNASYSGANVATGKVATISNSLTLAGTDATTMTFPTTSATIARTDAANTFTGIQTFNTAIAATSGGTAQSTYTTGDILYASGTNTLSKLTIGSSTQVLTVTGGVPVWGAAPTGITKSTITADQTGAINTSYTNNKVTTQLLLTLPAVAAVGDEIEIIGGSDVGGWRIVGIASAIFHVGAITGVTGTGGYVESLDQYATCMIRCIVANTEWSIKYYTGSVTIK